jgi:hypothetical protein
METLAAEFFNTVENNQNTFFMNWSSALDRANAETPLVKVRKEGFWGIFDVGKIFIGCLCVKKLWNPYPNFHIPLDWLLL